MRLNSASFRDPNGYVYTDKGVIYRQINDSYKENYDHLLSSGLYDFLVNSGQLIRHTEPALPYSTDCRHFKTIIPERIPFITYPYEWSFSMLKNAALLTLDIVLASIEYEMILKDASAYNIQFRGVKPVFIDTLSFEKFSDGLPWIAYRQFCQHFLAPLSLMSKVDVRLNKLLQSNIDGIPIDIASRLLPLRSLTPSLFFHIILHNKFQKRHAISSAGTTKKNFSKNALLGLLSNLKSCIKRLKWKPGGTEWAEYYQNTNYSDETFSQKKKIVERFIERTNATMIIDFGANTGIFSRIAASSGKKTILACDIDPSAVEINYIQCCEEKNDHILPLVIDLTCPSPSIGWANRERLSLHKREKIDLIMALALVHHMAISNNVPLEYIADYFHSLSNFLIIEFVPKEDSQVRRLLQTREDIFPRYTMEGFEQAFKTKYSIMEKQVLKNSRRVLYLMTSKVF